ncbi:MAG: hypothetical protein IPN19_07270 [Elusimicrobia bacterium]|nr:hypothetical protein [Elusimicrobiota bacterium]
MKMSAMGASLSLWQKRLVTGAMGTAWVSGLALFLIKTLGQTPSEFGLQRHALETPLRAAHGGAMMLVLAAVGSVLAVHVRAGWDTGLRRRSAFFLMGVLILLVATGWGHYYVSHESFRPWIEWLHTGVGIGLAPLFWIHSRRRDPF